MAPQPLVEPGHDRINRRRLWRGHPNQASRGGILAFLGQEPIARRSCVLGVAAFSRRGIFASG